MVAVNCAAIPPGLIESELFGHVKGAFTGAIKNRMGYFQNASNGTLFLDEIGELATEGPETVKNVNIRIIAATNLDLQKKRSVQDIFEKTCIID